ncbi:tRNA pseudouridine synthase-like 1 [Lamellibrachia satsuma]|nr:tRNA pseudouridine synthase-like 1 [Lamellibrachia satsuma]
MNDDWIEKSTGDQTRGPTSGEPTRGTTTAYPPRGPTSTVWLPGNRSLRYSLREAVLYGMATGKLLSTIWPPGSRSLWYGPREAALYGMAPRKLLSTIWPPGSRSLWYDPREAALYGFNGLAKQPSSPRIKTVVEVLERSLQVLQPSAPVQFVTSSRTDKGVHALCNTVHVDLTHRNEGVAYHPDVVTTVMNKKMVEMKEPVRVLKTRRVANDFHCRFRARSRSYVYRLSICRQPEQAWTLAYTPMEFMHSYFVRHAVDLDLLREGAAVMSGTHNYTNFTTAIQSWQNPVKTLSIDVRPGHGFLQEYSPFYRDQFDHWDLCYNSNSFLYKQIRKMTAVILAVGRGRLDIAVVRNMLDQPGEIQLKDSSIYNIPAHALYLTNIHYDEEDLKFEPTESIDEEAADDLERS